MLSTAAGPVIEGGAAPGRRPLAGELLVLALFAVLTIVMTWPWTAHLRDHVYDEGDSYLATWAMFWSYHQSFRDPLNLFNGNVFFPHALSLAFGECGFGLALPLFPLYAAGARPLTVHGVAILLGFVLCGYGTFRLVRTLTGSTPAAWVAGIAFAFVPYRFVHLNHVGYLSAGWIPLALEAAVLFAARPVWKRAAWLGVAALMCGLAQITWFVFSSVPLALSLPYLAARNGTLLSPRFWLRLAAALGAAGLLLAAFLLPYREVSRRHGFERQSEDLAVYATGPANWLQVSAENKLWRRFSDPSVNQDRALSPGLLLLLAPLGVAGLWFTRLRPDVDTVVLGTVWTVTGFLGSLGMSTPFHRLLHDWVLPFRSVRVPARWAMIGILGLALLAGAAVAALGKWRRGHWAACAIAGLLLFEQRSFPLTLTRGAADPGPVHQFLARTPMRGGIAELPTREGALCLYVLRAADHLKPLITANNSFVPAAAGRIAEMARRRPLPPALLYDLESVPASYLVVHEGLLSEEERHAIRVFLWRGMEDGRLSFCGRFGPPDVSELYAFTRTEPLAPSAGRPGWSATPGDLASGGPAPREDGTLLGSMDRPGDGSFVTGRLVVSGWARIPGEDLQVSVLIDGERRTPISFSRTARPDVAAAVPQLAPCLAAGFEAVFTPREGDFAAKHEVQVVFTAKEGRVRHFPAAWVSWGR